MYTMQRVTGQLRELLVTTVTDMAPEDSAALVTLETPPRPEFGDLSCPVAMKLARVLRRSPLAVAEELLERMRPRLSDYVTDATVTPPGYINFTYSERVTQDILAEIRMKGRQYGGQQVDEAGKVIIEHTNINPNKAAHVGHLRNACLGDTLARCHRKLGYPVEVQNYIDDTGTAVADIVVGFNVLKKEAPVGEPFDHVCWDLYTEVNSRYQDDPQLLEERTRVLQAIEAGDNDMAELARRLATRIVHCHLDTMAVFGIDYDLLTWEGHILQMGLWKHAFALLAEHPAVRKEETGANAGCWVIGLADHPEFSHLENPDKVLIRSSGTATYVAKDIAYQMWKFGLLNTDFGYEEFADQPSGRTLWTTCPTPSDGTDLVFGQAHRVINVIDARQKYLQDVVRVSLDTVGYKEEANNSVHFAYEVVSLSPATAEELGVEGAGGEGKGAVAMAGRQGIGVKVDDLLARMVQKARKEIRARRENMPDEEVDALAHSIAVSALRYYMLKLHPGSTVVFDFGEALSLQGNSGPYLQYAVARAFSILRRGGEAEGEPRWPDKLLAAEKALLLTIGAFPEMLLQATGALQPSLLTEYAYRLAGAFTDFYEVAPVLNAEEPVRGFRLHLVRAFCDAMTSIMDSLGLVVLESM